MGNESGLRVMIVAVGGRVTRAGHRELPDQPERELDWELVDPPGGPVHTIGRAGLVEVANLGLRAPARTQIAFGRPTFQQRMNGRSLLVEIRETCRVARRSPTARGTLSRLAQWFPQVTLRVAEVHRLLDRLPRTTALGIAGLPVVRRGRPREDSRMLQLVHTVDRLVQERGLSVVKAAELLARAGVHAGASRLRNLHANERVYALWHSEGVYVPESELVPRAWGAPKTVRARVYVDP